MAWHTLLPIGSMAYRVYRVFRPRKPTEPPPGPGGKLATIIATSTAVVVGLAFLTGKVPVELGQYPLLLTQAIVSALVATIVLGEGTGRSVARTTLGFIALCLAIYACVSLVWNAPGAFLEAQVTTVCEDATDWWRNRPAFPSLPDFKEVWEEHKPTGSPFWGDSPTPTPELPPTPTPSFIEGLLPRE